MATQPYLNAKGIRVPGVTTVIGVNLGWNKDALKLWANREGLAGREMSRQWGGETMTRAANIGTAAHAMIEAHVLGQDRPAHVLDALNDEDKVKAERGFNNFLRWYTSSRLRVIETETPYVYEKYQVGGTIDALFEQEPITEGDPLELALADWKSSKGTYADHFIQVSAYTVMTEARLSETRGEPVKLAGAHIVRVSKDTGAFKHVYWDRSDLELGWSAFTHLRVLHSQKQRIEAFTR